MWRSPLSWEVDGVVVCQGHKRRALYRTEDLEWTGMYREASGVDMARMLRRGELMGVCHAVL